MPARVDAAAAPHADLLDMRRGTAHLARVLNDLSDAQILVSATRRRIIADVSLTARMKALEAKALRSGLTDEEDAFDADVPFTMTLPIPALRHLFTHSALHLNVELRDLDDRHWPVLAHVPRQRAVAVWRAASAMRAAVAGSGAPASV
ncbi:MAG: maleylpyruvate isomerase [Pseudomonadota bacterium]